MSEELRELKSESFGTGLLRVLLDSTHMAGLSTTQRFLNELPPPPLISAITASECCSSLAF